MLVADYSETEQRAMLAGNAERVFRILEHFPRAAQHA